MSTSFKFPDGFLWGTATSAHQTEGNNTKSDWWEWEKNRVKQDRQYPLEESGMACDSYHRYEEDFDLCIKLNNNAVRLSIEWARIEPEEGKFDEKEIEHYKRVLISAKNRKLKVFATLHHFTNPQWFANKGGWESMKSPKYFARYAKKCAEEFGGLVDVFLTINEPQVYTLLAYSRAIWPPSKANVLLVLLVQFNMIRSHIAAYKTIKARGNYPVGIVKNVMAQEYTPHKFDLHDKLMSNFLHYLQNGFFLKPLLKYMDLIGLNYYFTNRIKNFRINNDNDVMSDLGWWIYPKGLEHVLLKLKKYNLPIYITENGLADAADKNRTWFIKEMLKACHRAIKQDVQLKGYFHWSLLDNYEWHEGYWPKFGLVEIDRHNNLERRPRKSFFYYSEVCKKNQVL